MDVQAPIVFQGVGDIKDILSKDYQDYDPLRDKQSVNCKEALRARKVNEINCCTIPFSKLLTRVVIILPLTDIRMPA